MLHTERRLDVPCRQEMHEGPPPLGPFLLDSVLRTSCTSLRCRFGSDLNQGFSNEETGFWDHGGAHQGLQGIENVRF